MNHVYVCVFYWRLARLSIPKGGCENFSGTISMTKLGKGLPCLHGRPHIQATYHFLDRARERAMRSSLNTVMNSMFLLIHSSAFMMASVNEPS